MARILVSFWCRVECLLVVLCRVWDYYSLATWEVIYFRKYYPLHIVYQCAITRDPTDREIILKILCQCCSQGEKIRTSCYIAIHQAPGDLFHAKKYTIMPVRNKITQRPDCVSSSHQPGNHWIRCWQKESQIDWQRCGCWQRKRGK